MMSTDVLSGRIYVIVNEKNQQKVNPEMIEQIYSDKAGYCTNGDETLVFELSVKSNTRERFAQNRLNNSAICNQRDWSNRFVNNTIKHDVHVKPQRLVARIVGLNETAIRYVPESEIANLSGLKIVMTID